MFWKVLDDYFNWWKFYNMIYKSEWVYSLFTLHINKYFYKLNNVFRFAPIGPLLSISSYNHIYLCFGKYHTIIATNENLTIWFTKVNELTVSLYHTLHSLLVTLWYLVCRSLDLHTRQSICIHQSISHTAKSIAHTERLSHIPKSIAHSLDLSKEYSTAKLRELWVAVHYTAIIYFYKLNNYFRFVPYLAPYFPFPSYNHIYLCYGKFHTDYCN